MFAWKNKNKKKLHNTQVNVSMQTSHLIFYPGMFMKSLLH